MRISQAELQNITKRSQPCAQARWFERHFGIKVQYDQQGPIITQEAFNALVMKKMGLSKNEAPSRPQVRLVHKNAA